MKVKDLLDVVNNIDYVIVSEEHKTSRYFLDNVPKEYNEKIVSEVNVYFEQENKFVAPCLCLWLEVEDENN